MNNNVQVADRIKSGFSCVHAGFQPFLSHHPQRDFTIENAIFKPNLSRIRHAIMRKTEGFPSAFLLLIHRSDTSQSRR